MAKTKKLVDLEIEETSGVDHPAHLYEGWLVRKDTAAVLDNALADVRNIEHDTDQGVETVDLTTTTDAPAEDVIVDDGQPVETLTVEVSKADDSVSEMVTKELADLRKALDDATAEAASLREEREMEKATDRAAAWRILPGVVVDEFAPVLRSIRGSNPEAATVIEGIFDGCAEAFAEAGVFKELGTDLDDSSADAYDQIAALAKSAVEAGRAKNQSEAIGLVASENPDLYARYRQEAGV
jgi:hypothetical protein